MSSDDDDYFMDDPYDKPAGAARGGGVKKKGGSGGRGGGGGGGGSNQRQQSKAAASGKSPQNRTPQNRSPQLHGQSGPSSAAGATAAPAAAVAAAAGTSSGKLETADKILNRLRWDDVLEVREFDIVYEDRFAGRMTIPAARFRGVDGQAAEGDAIPWHRVHQFTFRGRIVWDRDARMNLIDQLADEMRASRDAEDAAQEQAAATGMTSLKHLAGERVRIVVPPGAKAAMEAAAAAAAGTPTPSKKAQQQQQAGDNVALQPLKKGQPLRVVTYNILHDIFDGEDIYTDARLPFIANEIEAQKPDVILLQEVTLQRFRDLLSLSSTLRQGFYWTYMPSAVSTVQVTGSRFPLMEGFAETVSRNKRRIYALMENPWAAPFSAEAKQLPVLVVNCHFLSDHGGGAVSRRLGEVRDINKNLSGFPRVILGGDFNFGDVNQESSVIFDNLADAWVQDYMQLNNLTSLPEQAEYIAAGQAPKKGPCPIGGFTFDITRNPLANISCEHHRYPRRLDRIMQRAFTVAKGSAKVFGVEPYPAAAVPKAALAQCEAAKTPLPDDGNIYPSDHFGVAVELLMDEGAFTKGVSSAAASGSGAEASDASITKAAAAAAAAPIDIAGGALFSSAAASSTPSPAAGAVSDPVIAAMSKAGGFSKFFRSALVFLPPPALFERINRFRGNGRDKAFPRWMPHTTILFPFVHPDQFPQAIALIETALRAGTWVRQTPFRVRVEKTGEFRKKDGSVVFLQPECIDTADRSNLGVAPMRRVFEPLQRLFPTSGRDGADDSSSSSSSPTTDSNEAAARAASRYSPHFTLGQTKNQKDHAEFVARVTAEWEPVEFDMTQFHLIAHLDGKGGFEVIRSFDLPTSSSTAAAAAAAAGTPAAAVTAASATGAAGGGDASGQKKKLDSGDATTEPMATILEPPQWGSRLLKPYVPPDPLEKWLAKVSISKYARDCPTHISQLGGMYHVDSSQLDEYLRRWRESFVCREHVPGYIEEVRGSPFRLYVDLDFDLSSEDPVSSRYALDLVRELAMLVARIFAAGSSGGAEVDPTALVFECHGSASKKFADGSVPGPAANDDDNAAAAIDAADVRAYKSGYRVYFQRIFLDGQTTYDKVLNAMSNYLRRRQWPLPENLVRGTGWDDIIDKKAVTWDRGRLLGTIKRRKNLKRIYDLAAVVDVRGTNEVVTREFQKSVLRQLYGSTLRLWDVLPRPDEETGMPVLMDNEFTVQRMQKWSPEAEEAAATAHEQ